jgi:hypothetical protein
MAQHPSKEPKTAIVAHAPVPLKLKLETIARMQNISLSQVVINALTEHFVKLGVA